MAVVDVMDKNGNAVSQRELRDDVFGVDVKPAVLHEVVTMQLASRRSGTASVRHRSDVRGSTRKLFRQKGTGRARGGDIKSPLLRGGGSVFGPNPKSWAYKVPKKVRRLALKMALSLKLAKNKLVVIDGLDFSKPKTKDFVAVIDALKLENVLLVIGDQNENLERSARNVPRTKVLRTEGLNVYDILKYKHLVLLEGCIQAIEGRLSA
jgi:large subunit ribosomal protein L4